MGRIVLEEPKQDFHIHSLGSSDGRHSIEYLQSRAEEKGVDTFAITDHNNLTYVRHFLKEKNLPLDSAIHHLDGIDFIPGVEVTCRIEDVANLKGNTVKVHLIVLCPNLDPNLPFSRLMKAKHSNDIAVDFGLLVNIGKLRGVNISERDVRMFMDLKKETNKGFSTFGKEDIWDFMAMHSPGALKSRKQIYDMSLRVPQATRMTITAREVIDVAHDAGGLVFMAHPQCNLNRTSYPKQAIKSLIESGIDGFEVHCASTTPETVKMIEDVCETSKLSNPILYSGGSDFHRVGQGSELGTMKDSPLTEDLFKSLNRAIRELQKCREVESLTNRRYKPVLKEDIEKTVKKYEDFAKANSVMENGERFPIFDKVIDDYVL